MDINGTFVTPVVFVQGQEHVVTGFAVPPNFTSDIARVTMTPSEAREYATRLMSMADEVEGR